LIDCSIEIDRSINQSIIAVMAPDSHWSGQPKYNIA